MNARSAIARLELAQSESVDSLEFTLMRAECDRCVYGGSVFELDIDCTTIERCYRVEWSPLAGSVAIVSHWGNDCIAHTTDLDVNEVRELEQWLAAEDEVAGYCAELKG